MTEYGGAKAPIETKRPFLSLEEAIAAIFIMATIVLMFL